MATFTVMALDADLTAQVRRERRDRFDNNVVASVAGEQGYGPCRACLRQFRPGERRLLLAHAPLAVPGPYREVGPIYMHEADCGRYTDLGFPSEVKAGRLPIPLALRAYDETGKLSEAVLVPDNATVEAQIERLLADPTITEVHVRNAQFGCYITKAIRA